MTFIKRMPTPEAGNLCSSSQTACCLSATIAVSVLAQSHSCVPGEEHHVFPLEHRSYAQTRISKRGNTDAARFLILHFGVKIGTYRVLRCISAGATAMFSNRGNTKAARFFILMTLCENRTLSSPEALILGGNSDFFSYREMNNN